MSGSWLFAVGLGLTVAIVAGAVRYLRPPLLKLLVELCGNRERAEFWVQFSSIVLALVPVLCALDYRPNAQDSLVFALAGQLMWAIAGLVASLLVLGWTLNQSIRRLGR